MIQDRLTAKFQSAKPAARRAVKFKPVAAPKAAKAPVADRFTKGRRLSGSFWI